MVCLAYLFTYYLFNLAALGLNLALQSCHAKALSYIPSPEISLIMVFIFKRERERERTISKLNGKQLGFILQSPSLAGSLFLADPGCVWVKRQSGQDEFRSALRLSFLGQWLKRTGSENIFFSQWVTGSFKGSKNPCFQMCLYYMSQRKVVWVSL